MTTTAKNKHLAKKPNGATSAARGDASGGQGAKPLGQGGDGELRSQGRSLFNADSRSLREKERLTGIGKSTLARYASGQRVPPSEERARIETGLGIPAKSWGVAPGGEVATASPLELAPGGGYYGLIDHFRAQRLAAGDLDYSWLAAAGQELNVLEQRLEELEEGISAADWLRAAPSYHTLLGLVAVRVGVTALPQPTVTEQISQLESIRSEVEALQIECLRRLRVTNRVVRDEDMKGLGVFARRTHKLLQDLSLNLSDTELAKSPAWLALAPVFSQLLRGNVQEREALIASLEGDGGALARSLADVLRKVRHIEFPCKEFRDDPVGFCRIVLGFEPWSGQRQILEAIRDNRLVTIRSGQKVGKTRIIMAAALWWWATRDNAQVLISNNTGSQLEKEDWKEVCHLHRRSGVCADCLHRSYDGPKPCPHSQVLDGKPRSSSQGSGNTPGGLVVGDRALFGKTASTDEGLLGFSGAELLIIVDEASTLSEEMFNAFLGNCASKGSKMVLAGNPLRVNCPFHATHTRLSNIWHSIRISAEEAAAEDIPGLASKEHIAIAEASDDLGRESVFFQVRILGEFPSREERAIYPYDVVVGMMDRDKWAEQRPLATGPLMIALDPAGGGRDESVFTVGRGLVVLEQRAVRGLDSNQHLELAIQLAKQYGVPSEDVYLVIDCDGVGAPIKQAAWAYSETVRRQVKFKVVEFYFGHNARADQLYDLRADEAHMATRTWADHGGVVPYSAKLEQELEKYEWCMVRRNRSPGYQRNEVEVQSGTRKKDIRVMIHRSPDRCDSLRMYCMCWYEVVYQPNYESEHASPYEAELEEQERLNVVDERRATREAMRRIRRNPFSG